ADDWKGSPEESVLSVGGLAGLGMVNSTTGLAVLGTVSKKILPQGFISEITNSASVEAQVGPVLGGLGGAAWIYSLHLRWDFEKDKNWTLYALGGLGGVTQGILSSVTPRFGVGAFWKMSGPLNIRAELSHNLIAVGVNLPFY
ncbi:MAG: hypothetical protein ACO3A2_07955, partial [Bdellovibrionia bacterium]